MAANKEKIVRGIHQLLWSFPFFLLGPGLYFWKGAKGLNNGEWWWTVISVLAMLAAAIFVVRGLRLIMAGLFND